jgi:two-component system chemotaxis response regulator CheB
MEEPHSKSPAGQRKAVRVVVVDDSPLACKIVTDALSFDEDVEVIGTAHDGLAALELIHATRPDVVTLDMTMPDLDGMGVLDALDPATRPGIVVIALGPDMGDLRRLGVHEVVRKRTASDDELFDLLAEIVGAVKNAALGRSRAGG